MESKKHIVIYSHGFGVRKDDRGLLSNIAESLPEVESILFDYYLVDEENKTITMCPPSEQAAKLTKVVHDAQAQYPEAIIDIIAHSQGTLVPALAQLHGIRKTILLAPVFDMSVERTLKKYRERPGAEVNLEGISKFPPVDGLTRLIPAEYWVERAALRPIEAYNNFTDDTELIVIEAKQDNILEKVDLSDLSPKIKQIPMDGDHGFYYEARQPLIDLIRNLLLL